MKKILTAKWFIVAATSLLLIAGVVLSLIPGSPLGFLKAPFAAIATPVQAFVKSAGDTLSDFWAALTDGMAIRQENEDLKDQIADLQYQLTQNEEAAIRYEELKEAFHIRDTFSNYDIYGASIKVELMKFLRPEQPFSGVEELKAAVEDNKKQAREFFSSLT